ncbi:hypothetical protein [Corynebacterium sp.]|uniref:hypothetical protein n=1 Tax=Corynebacterium sp. TaxID=1720 RepID=UPI0026DD78A2|nr:hypothetical protein [Corynebacterium sp.]MDO5032569.1 hypothetical protein [Corynebacterium sp.]
MKRLTAGVVAVAAALSLSTATASAATWEDAFVDAINKSVFSDPHYGSYKGSSEVHEQNPGSSEAFKNFYGSSYKNDFKEGYQFGTTADILWGVGIAAAVLGTAAFAVQNGMIPGVSLPQL